MPYQLHIKRTGEIKEVDPKHIPGMVVELKGGGFTEVQTMAAMQANHDLEQGIPIETDKYKLEKVESLSVDAKALARIQSEVISESSELKSKSSLSR